MASHPEHRPPGTAFRIALISMPWAILNRPSIQLGTLQAWLARDSALQPYSFYPYLQAAKAIGTETYYYLAQNGWAGEALYSPLLFPEHQPQALRLFNHSCRGTPHLRGLNFDQTVHALDLALDQWLAGLNLDDFDLVGFTICFNQLLPSLTAAQRIKKLRPDLPVVAGGSGCVGPTGASLLANFPQLDYIISGEGEEALDQLCHCLQQGCDPQSLPLTVLHRHRPFTLSSCPGLADLHDLPTPEYSPYFHQMQEVFPGQPFIPVLPVEFSRGCWWNRCAFCNLNQQWQGYRWKQSTRVTDDVVELSRRHGCLDFTFTDNALPPREADLFFQTMAESPHAYEFFAEIRAIADPGKLAAYRRGGLTTIQVGIEALSTSLLTRMDKGITAMDNIAAMKQSRACHIRLDGNLIMEFPGSTEEEVTETLDALDFVLPFTPLAPATFFLGHGSPVWNGPEQFGITAITQHPKNRQLFPARVLATMDMLLTGYKGQKSIQHRLWKPVVKKIARWQAFHAHRSIHDTPALSYRDGGSFLIIRQERLDGPCLHHRLKGRSREIYLYCRDIRHRDDLARQFPDIDTRRLHDFLADLTAKRLLFQEKDRYLALAIAASSH